MPRRETEGQGSAEDTRAALEAKAKENTVGANPSEPEALTNTNPSDGKVDSEPTEPHSEPVTSVPSDLSTKTDNPFTPENEARTTDNPSPTRGETQRGVTTSMTALEEQARARVILGKNEIRQHNVSEGGRTPADRREAQKIVDQRDKSLDPPTPNTGVGLPTTVEEAIQNLTQFGPENFRTARELELQSSRLIAQAKGFLEQRQGVFNASENVSQAIRALDIAALLVSTAPADVLDGVKRTEETGPQTTGVSA